MEMTNVNNKTINTKQVAFNGLIGCSMSREYVFKHNMHNSKNTCVHHSSFRYTMIVIAHFTLRKFYSHYDNLGIRYGILISQRVHNIFRLSYSQSWPFLISFMTYNRKCLIAGCLPKVTPRVGIANGAGTA
jgi:hypothetical protein